MAFAPLTDREQKAREDALNNFVRETGIDPQDPERPKKIAQAVRQRRMLHLGTIQPVPFT